MHRNKTMLLVMGESYRYFDIAAQQWLDECHIQKSTWLEKSVIYAHVFVYIR